MKIINMIIMLISTLAVGLATALGLVTYGGMPLIMSGVSAVIIVLGMIQIQIMMSRARRRLGLHGKMRSLLKASASLSEEVLSLREQVETQAANLDRLKQQNASIVEDQIAPLQLGVERLGDEFRAINAVNGDLTESVLASGKKLAGFAKLIKRLEKKQKNLINDVSKSAVAAKVAPSVKPAAVAQTGRSEKTERTYARSPAARSKTASRSAPNPARHETILNAIDQNRIDLYLQPVVTLPQRKVRFYEALTRLHTADGETIQPGEYMPVAKAAGRMPAVDNLLLFRSVKVLRRLAERKRKVGVFCNISPDSLTDDAFFPQLMDFLGQNRSLAGSLNFEFPQSMIDNFGPMEFESLAALNDLGFRFSLDHVRTLNADFQKLNETGFRYIKVDADILLNRMNEADTWVHTADLSDLMQRHGLHLIAEKIETESMVLDLLDYNVDLAQGYLFGKPAQVRDDILGGKKLEKQSLRMAS